MSHFIPLTEAAAMTARFQNNKESILVTELRNQDILTICERFDRSAIDTILAKTGCVSIRIYYGMDEDLKVHALLVGVNANDQDLIVVSSSLTNEEPTTDEEDIAERAYRCPPYCPTDSPLIN
jgi:hypothetical protein